MRSARLIEATERGLFCEAGGFYIDPWKPVDRAVVTHGHSDHATWGCARYLCSAPGVGVLKERVHAGARIEGAGYGESVLINGVKVSLHPAGHVLGSAQVRVEHGGRVEVVTGDYKVVVGGEAAGGDATCAGFEVVGCDRLITECTFGLPIYRWRPEGEVAAEIDGWWRGNVENGRTSVVFAYALGKAQRVLSMVDRGLCEEHGVVVHGSVKRFVDVYRDAGVDLPAVSTSTEASRARVKGKGLVVAPPSVLGTPWLKKFGPYSTAFASGWMAVRGNRRRRGVDRGFVVSDHVDWAGLMGVIEATGASEVGATHGYVDEVARYLNEQGEVEADVVATRYEGEGGDEREGAGEEEVGGGAGPTDGVRGLRGEEAGEA
ncbi:MAG: ligase-associated DNA damage response exonuclease [Planctomycetota bacterium]